MLLPRADFYHRHDSARYEPLWCHIGFWLAQASQPHGVWLGTQIITIWRARQNHTAQGPDCTPLHISTISTNKVYKATKSNELWAFVLLDYTPIPNPTQTPQHTTTKEDIQHLLTVYKDVFTDPQLLPPKRSYDHAIPLLPNSIPINARPYHYSPTHKTEIENQVQQLLQAGLITHSHSPFASPVLLVKKKMAPGVFV